MMLTAAVSLGTRKPRAAHRFSMTSCLFCKIASGEIPAEKVAESERAFAFLDIRPLARGHVLVVPKRHVERIADLSPEDASAVMHLAQRVIRRQSEVLRAEGVTLAVNDGRAAGQEVLHVHVHLVPRSEKDGSGPIHRMFPGVQLRDGELREIGAMLRG
jgi:histidine triad (HIT) family protein